MVIGILSMTDLVLKKNTFELNSENFLQMSGTAIGTKMVPAYANIFMSVYERALLSGTCNQPYVWLRYIDDIFVIWTHGEAKLKELVSLKKRSSGIITTDLYVKPTDTHQYLLATSCHPNHKKRNIPYSPALRILRICSNLETARLRCSELTDSLVKRGYNTKR